MLLTRRPTTALALCAALSGVPIVAAADPEWPQWGGPNRDFVCHAPGLATQWPEKGPAEIWSRELGEGYSAILADGDRLYTMYRVGEDELAIGLDRNTGKTIWEHKYNAPIVKGKMGMNFGLGPHSTPLIVGDRLFTVGVTGKLHCFDKKDGKVLWSHDLVSEYGGAVMFRGYSCSPIAWKDTVILSVGSSADEEDPQGNTEPPKPGEAKELPADRFGPGRALMAFDQQTGSVRWEKHTFHISHASPILIKLEGQDQLVVMSTDEAIGLNPDNGDHIWSHPHTTEFGANITTPVWGPDNILFVTCAYRPGGSRAILLKKEGGKTVPEELWYSNKMRVHFGNVVRLGDRVLGSSGDMGPSFFVALELKNKGKLAFRARDFKKSTCLVVDDKLIILDEDGWLGIATPDAEGLRIHAKAQVLASNAWTVPTLVGTKLYVRDRKTIKALDLGGSQS